MYVKKNLLLWLAVFTMALPLLFVGTAGASAGYFPDGAEQNGTTGGWNLPADKGACLLGIAADGTLTYGPETSNPDCVAHKFANDAAYTTQALCGSTSNTDGGAHFWAKMCIADDGSFISLNGLDRTAAMCTKAAIAAGHTSATYTTNKCTGSWVYKGTALDNSQGFCSTTVKATDYTQATCPTTSFGYSYSATNGCTFTYGISGGVTPSAINKLDGTANIAANGAIPNLSTYNMGQCLLGGFKWDNYNTKSGTTTINGSATTVGVMSGTRGGCLRCHSNTSQTNGYAERWKSKQVNTGHKNMLRKVTAGANWAGPNGAVYTVDAAGNTIDFVNARVNSQANNTLYYIFGDWLAATPETVGVGAQVTAYSCANCHVAGWRNEDTTKGLCSDTNKTTAAACTGSDYNGIARVWTPSSGIMGYGVGGAQPATDFPSGTPGATETGTWDQDGIVCSRCHAASFPAVYSTTIAPAVTGSGICSNNTNTNATDCGTAGATWYNTVTGTHNSTGAGTDTTRMCFGCHQAIPKDQNIAGAKTAGVAPNASLSLDKIAVYTTYRRDINSHSNGNNFLNSPHARATNATIKPNALGKYDLATATYNSSFIGKVCRTSNSIGGGSIVTTNGAGGEIKTQADCTALGYFWVNEGTSANSQGNCTTCHDVHQSLEVAGHEAIRRECKDCHGDAKTVATVTTYNGPIALGTRTINHPTTPGTPEGISPGDSCVVCHMPKSVGGGENFPSHYFRINTNAAYDTFPTVAAFEAAGVCIDSSKVALPAITTRTACLPGTCSVAAAITVSACDAAIDATQTNGYGKWTTASTNSWVGTAVANASPEAYSGGTYNLAVWSDLDMACGQCHGGSAGTGATKNGAPYLSKAGLASGAAQMHNAGYVPPVCTAPQLASHGTVTQTGYTVNFADTSTDPADISNVDVVTVNWGDGGTSTGIRGGIFSHTFTGGARSVSIVHMVRSSCNSLLVAKEKIKLNVPVRYNVMGIVRQSDNSTAITGATVVLRVNGHTRQVTTSDGIGSFTFANVLPGSYTIHVYKAGVTFGADVPVTVTTGSVAQNVQAVTP